MTILELLIVLILIFWLIGAFAYPVGSLIHVLLVVVVVLIIIRIVQGRSI